MSTRPRPHIELDGSTLEGGGQLLRNAVALSALTHTAVHIPNVRQGRAQPGLKAQHAAGLQLVTQISNARAEGTHKGSITVSFDATAGSILAGTYDADPGTAASTTLLLQVSLPVLLFPEHQQGSSEDPELRGDDDDNRIVSTLTLRGGTNALNAPQADYAQHVLFPFLRSYILPPPSSSFLTLDIVQRGFYPHGGGTLRSIIPALKRGETLRFLTLTNRGEITHISGLVIVSGAIGQRIANELRTAALSVLSSSPSLPTGIPIEITIQSTPKARASSGSSILLFAHTSTLLTLSSSALGARGTLATSTASVAAHDLLRNVHEGGCVDEWMQDQMIVFLALAKGRSTVRTGKITLHTRTAVWVAEKLTGAKFEMQENIDGTGQALISCEGIGLEGRM